MTDIAIIVLMKDEIRLIGGVSNGWRRWSRGRFSWWGHSRMVCKVGGTVILDQAGAIGIEVAPGTLGGKIALARNPTGVTSIQDEW